jgi:hypothetical protein
MLGSLHADHNVDLVLGICVSDIPEGRAARNYTNQPISTHAKYTASIFSKTPETQSISTWCEHQGQLTINWDPPLKFKISRVHNDVTY